MIHKKLLDRYCQRCYKRDTGRSRKMSASKDELIGEWIKSGLSWKEFMDSRNKSDTEYSSAPDYSSPPDYTEDYVPHANKYSGESIKISPIPSYDEMENLRDKIDYKTSSSQAYAINEYQGSEYDSINLALMKANGDIASVTNDYIRKLATNISSAMKPIGKDLTLYRYQGMSMLKNAGFDPTNPQAMVGKVLEFTNFVSTAYDPNKPSSFYDKPHMLVMRVPKSAKGFMMADHDWESEILLKNNTAFKVSKIERVGKYWVTYVDYLGQK